MSASKDVNLISLFSPTLLPSTIYRVLKRIGGHWLFGGPGQHHQVDGDKFICLDSILKQNSCIVYSFGVAYDWTFEDQMDDIGFSCRVSEKRWAHFEG